MGNIAAGDAIGAGAETEMGTAMAAGGGMNVTCIRMRGKTKKKSSFLQSFSVFFSFVCFLSSQISHVFKERKTEETDERHCE